MSPINVKAIKPSTMTVTQEGTETNLAIIQRTKATTTRDTASMGIAFFDFHLALSSSFISFSVFIQCQLRPTHILPQHCSSPCPLYHQSPSCLSKNFQRFDLPLPAWESKR